MTGRARRGGALPLVVRSELEAVGPWSDRIMTPSARGLMRCLARSGDLVGARKVYKVLSEALQHELDDPGARPAPATRALLAELIAAEQGG